MSDVNLSAEQVYAELRKIGDNVVSLMVKVDGLVNQGADHEKRLVAQEIKTAGVDSLVLQAAGQEKRVSILERKMAVVYALASVLGVVFGTVAGIITEVIIK